MFGKSTLVAAVLAFAAAALAQPTFQCPVGSPQCCHSSRDAKSFDHGMMPPPGLPGFDHGMPDGLVGFVCKSMDDMSCPMPLCCDMNNFGGILTFGCIQAKPVYYPPQPTYYPPKPTSGY